MIQLLYGYNAKQKIFIDTYSKSHTAVMLDSYQLKTVSCIALITTEVNYTKSYMVVREYNISRHIDFRS